MTDPTLARPRIRALRRSIDPATAAANALAVRDAVLAMSALGGHVDEGLRVGSYLPHDGELDAEPLASALRLHGASTWYPVVSDHPAEPLEFRRWDGVAPLRVGAHRIAIPPPGDTLDGARLSVVIVPLVGFDSQRHRFGMGVGHYDRTFAKERLDPEARPMLLGVAHDEQQVDQISARPWDVRLDLIVTPTQVIG